MKVLVIEPISMGVVDVYCWPEAAVLMEPGCPGALTGTIQSSSHPVIQSTHVGPARQKKFGRRTDVMSREIGDTLRVYGGHRLMDAPVIHRTPAPCCAHSADGWQWAS